VRDGKALAAAGGADIILSTTNSVEAMNESIGGLRPDGRFVAVGSGGGAVAVGPGPLIGKRVRVIGSTQNGRRFLYEALDFAARGKVKVIAETFTLDEAPKAYARVAEGAVRFRAVLAM